MNKTLIFVLAAVLAALACSTLVASFPAGPGEKTGEALDNAGRAVGGAARDAGNAISRGASNVADKTSDAWKDTKNAVNDNINGAPTTSAASMLFLAISSFTIIKAAGIFV